MRYGFGRLAAPILFLSAGIIVVTAGSVVGQPGKDKEPGKEKKDKDKGAKDKGVKGWEKGGGEKDARELRQAYDHITTTSQDVPAGKEANRLLEHAKTFYRGAIRSFPDDPRRARELAVAATEAVRGLDHLRKASFQPIAGLPEPPTGFDGALPKDEGPKKGKGAPPPPKDGPNDAFRPGARERGPWTPALDALTEVHTRLASMDSSARGAARDFQDAARTAYRQAHNAYDAGEFRKSAELARAAAAWLRVGEHLESAQWDGPPEGVLAPSPKQKGAPPPPPLIK
jgi:hypothetical protein